MTARLVATDVPEAIADAERKIASIKRELDGVDHERLLLENRLLRSTRRLAYLRGRQKRARR